MALPPTSSKLSSDANEVTTFKFDFPNFTGTHTATNLTLGVNAVAGGGTSVAFLPVNSVFLGNGTSTPTFVAPSTAGNVLTSDGTTWTSAVNPGTGAITQLTGDVTATGPGVVPATVASVGGSSAASVGAAAVAVAAATSADTPNTLVLRDGSGNFSAGTITASLTGHASLDVPLTDVGAPNGVASLDPSGKVPASQLSATLLEYKGNWDPSTNTPTLVDGTGTNGDTYRVSTMFAGPVVGLNDPSMVNFQVGNLVIYSSTTNSWQQTGSVTGVTSVNGAVGTVTVNAINQLTGDVTAGPASGSASAVATLTAVTNSTLATLSALSLPVSQLTGVLPVPNGGTGASSFNAFSIPLTGTTTTGAFTDTGPGTSGQILTSNGTGAFPTWQAAPSVGTNGGAGTILAFGGTVVPTGFVLCDGSSYLISTYPDLAAALFDISTGKYAYGAPDGTHFNVPQLEGYFLRGTSNGTGNDPDASSRTALQTGGNTGDNVGSFQTDAADISGSLTGSFPITDATGGGGQPAALPTGFPTTLGPNSTYSNVSISGGGGGTETRPKNVYVNFIIQTVPGTGGGGGGSGTVTSVDMTVPAFLSVTGNPITTSGTLAVTLSGTALPTANGGTGLTAPGTSGNVLTSNGTIWTSAPASGGFTDPMTTTGDMIYSSDNTPTPTRLPIGTTGQVLSVSSGIPAWTSPIGASAFAQFASTLVNTGGNTTSATYVTFSNSPAFTITPTISGTYKIYCGAPVQVNGSNAICNLQITNTSGGATLLQQSQTAQFANTASIGGTVYIQSTYTLLSGNTYVFDIQGQVMAGSGTVILDGGDAPFYMFAEGISLQNPFTFQSFISSQVTTDSSSITSGSFVTASNSPALSFTPIITGKYKVYASLPVDISGTGGVGICRIFETSAVATLLAESQTATSVAGASSGLLSPAYIQSMYTLTAGTAYVFDFQVKTNGTTIIAGSNASFYLFAELCG